MTGTHISVKSTGTAYDQRDMRVMGKLQELRRNFRFISILGFACTLMSTWEIVLASTAFALNNGGSAGLIWTFVIVVVGYSFVFGSLAEMASMAPTSGGQYHWVSEFAPRRFQRLMSYMTGWLCVWGWLSGIAGVCFFTAQLIEALIILNHPTFVPQPYHATLLIIAVAAFSIFFNTFLAKKLPLVEAILLLIHIAGFFAILIPLWTLAPRANAKDVFTTFHNGGGWNSEGTSALVGILTAVISLTGSDSAAHMSEETKDAGVVLPRSIMWSIVVNGSLGFIMLVTFCFTLGDLDSILQTPTYSPLVQVFFNTTNSYAGSNVMTAIIIITLIASAISTIATCSRQLWAFARDKGLPFSSILAHVYQGWDIPLNAIFMSFIVTAILSLINLGSTVAIQAVASLSASMLLTSYMVSISTLLLRRYTGPNLPTRRWSLGRWGAVVNIVALCFLSVFWIFSFFPPTAVVTTTTMNWNSLMFAIIVVVALVYYLLKARHEYVGPVMLVKRDS
ncbi:putative GABA permease [Hyaloscypha finlandica]|nr:putative GABA permease [Hyaloscypha finlandica]